MMAVQRWRAETAGSGPSMVSDSYTRVLVKCHASLLCFNILFF